MGQDVVGGHRDEERVHRAEAGGETPERGRQVEAESVHAHVVRPVAQRVQHHLDGLGVVHVHRVTGAGHVDGLDGARGGVAVVHVGVQASPRQGGAGVAALARVVVDDVEDDLDAGLVQEGDHAAELVDDGLGAGCARLGGRVRGFGGEEGQRRVAPVVRQAALGEERFVALGVHGEQLDRCDAQVLQIRYRGRVSQARVGAAQLWGYAGHVLGEALDVDLVDHGRFPRRLGLGDDRERGLDHDRARHVGSGIDGGATHRVFRRVQILVHAVRVDAGLHVDDAVDTPAVGVEEELVRVVELATVRIPGAVNAEAVAGPRAKARDVTVPDAGMGADQTVACLSPGLVENAHIHAGRAPRDHGHIEPVARTENSQAGGDGVRFGDAHGGDAGRAGALGHKRMPLSDELLTAPNPDRRSHYPSYVTVN